jgi:nitrate reductase NapD
MRDDGISRRRFLTGGAGSEPPYFVSSAVVRAFPHCAQAVASAIAALPGAEVHAVEDSRIVVVLEARESGANGARLAEIALMEGVLSANLVYEQADVSAGGEDDVSHQA